MKCKKHPKYQGLRKPKILNGDFIAAANSGCTCWGVWRKKQRVHKRDLVRIQRYSKKLNGKLAKVVDISGGYVLVKPLHYPRNAYVDLLTEEVKKVFKHL
jgi:hypothetical protein